jgi:CAS/CSE protein, C-terminus
MWSQEDVQEFHPYVFQIFAQLIEVRPAPLPPSYMAIFPPLLTPLFWERSGNVPALVRLLKVGLELPRASPWHSPISISMAVLGSVCSSLSSTLFSCVEYR